MRITPLCVWARRLPPLEFEKAVKQETKFTHVNFTAINAAVAYGLIIYHLLNHKGDSEGGYAACIEYIARSEDSTLQSWMEELKTGLLPPASEKIEWVKIPLLYTMYYIRERKDYLEAMKECWERVAIRIRIGGALGTLHGKDKIPS